MAYVIKKVTNMGVDWPFAMSKSELKRRLAVICNRSGPSDAIKLDAEDIRDEDIDTLVNGEAGQGVKYCETCQAYHNDGAGCPGRGKESEMGERMTVKQFDRLKQIDFHNGAVLDEIRYSLGMLEELVALHGEKPWPTPDDILKMRGKEQPPAGLFHGPGLPSKEQPDPWEEWIGEVWRLLMEMGLPWNIRWDIIALIRKMPRGK